MKTYHDALQGQPLNAGYKLKKLAASIPDFLRPLICKVLKLKGEYRKAFLFSKATRSGLLAKDLFAVTHKMKKFEEAWLRLFNQLKLDFIVYPCVPLPAWPHGMGSNLFPSCTYTFMMNILRWPTGTLPITTVKKGEDRYYMKKNGVIDVFDPGFPDIQKDSLARYAHESMTDSVGMPIGVQVMTPLGRDEQCLRYMKEVEQVMNVGIKDV